MGTLLSIAQDALKEIGDTNVPTTIYNNTDPTAVQLLALLTRAGKTLRREKWQALLKTATITTSNGTQTYALPADWNQFDPLTTWDATNTWAMVGPVSPATWNTLQYSSLAHASVRTFYRVAANLIALFPTPTSVRTLNYAYRSKYWIGSLTKEAFTDDADVPDLDDQLLIADLKWRWRQAKGLEDWVDLRKDAMDLKDSLIASDGGKDAIRFGARRGYWGDNIPEQGFGP